MNILSHPLFRRAIWRLVPGAWCLACTEPRTPQPVATPAPALEARVELSDSLPRVGAELIVGVRLRGESAPRIASFTERVSYDTTGLRYLADVAQSDGATRVSNPTSGLIRSAGVRPDGFADGVLVQYRFLVLQPGAAARLQLTIDELHELSRTDALASVQVQREPVLRLP
jgi:hypothetical protein